MAENKELNEEVLDEVTGGNESPGAVPFKNSLIEKTLEIIADNTKDGSIWE